MKPFYKVLDWFLCEVSTYADFVSSVVDLLKVIFYLNLTRLAWHLNNSVKYFKLKYAKDRTFKVDFFFPLCLSNPKISDRCMAPMEESNGYTGVATPLLCHTSSSLNQYQPESQPQCMYNQHYTTTHEHNVIFFADCFRAAPSTFWNMSQILHPGHTFCSMCLSLSGAFSGMDA